MEGGGRQPRLSRKEKNSSQAAEDLQRPYLFLSDRRAHDFFTLPGSHEKVSFGWTQQLEVTESRPQAVCDSFPVFQQEVGTSEAEQSHSFTLGAAPRPCRDHGFWEATPGLSTPAARHPDFSKKVSLGWNECVLPWAAI